MSSHRPAVTSRLRLAALLAAVGLAASGAQAATWDNFTPGTYNWADGTNWSIKPSYPGDGVTTDNVATITLSNPINGLLTINNPGLAASLGSLTLGMAGTTTTADAVTLNINGATSITGNVSATSSATTGVITLNVNANTTVGGALTATAGTSVNVANNAVLGVTGAVNLSGATLSLAAGSLTGTNVTLNNTGSYNLNAGGKMILTGTLSNNNTTAILNLNDATSSISADTMSAGTSGFNVQGTGSLVISGSFTTNTNGFGNNIFNTSGSISIGTMNLTRSLSGNANPNGSSTGVHFQNGVVTIGDLLLGTQNSSTSFEVTNTANVTVTGNLQVGQQNNSGRRSYLVVNNGTFNANAAVVGLVRVSSGNNFGGNGGIQVNGGVASIGTITLGGTRAAGGNSATEFNTGFLGVAGGTLYVGAGGIVGINSAPIANNTIGSRYDINLSGGTVGAMANWSSSASMTLSGPATFHAADAAGAAHSITLSGVLSGAGSLVKTGTGAVTLSGPNTFSGGVTVNAGLLVANAPTGSAFGTGAIIVNSGATLGGVGNDFTVGSVTISAGATLSPGVPGVLNGIGTLNFNTLTLADGSTLTLDFSSNPVANDRLNFLNAPNLTLGNQVFVNVFTAGTTSTFNYNGDYKIMTGISPSAFTANVDANNVVTNLVWADTASPLGHTFKLVPSTDPNLRDIVLTITGGISSSKWTGGVSSTWNVAGNWTAGIADSAGAVANFLGDATGYTVAPNGTRTVGTMAIDSGTNSGYTFTGGQITLNNNGSQASIGIAGGNNLINSAIELADNTTVTTLAASNTLTLAGSISSATGKGLTIIGPGKVLLAGSNSYGTTAIDTGANLQLGDGGATGSFGTGAVTNNGQVTFNLGTAATVPNAISGAGSLTQAGTGAVTLTGLNSYTGPTTVNAGSTLIIDYAAGGLAPATTLFAPGTITFRGGASGGTQTFSTALNLQGGTINVVGGSGGTMAVSFASTSLGDNGTVNVTGDTGAAALALNTVIFGATNTLNVGGAVGGSLSLSNATIPSGVTINANAGGTVALSAATTTFANGSTINVGGGATAAHLSATASILNPTTTFSVKSNGVAALGNTTFNGVSTLSINGGTATLGTLTLPLRAEVTLGGGASTLDVGGFVRSGLGAFNASGTGAILTNSTNSGFVGGWATLNGNDFAAISGTSIVPSTSADNTWNGDNVSVTANTNVPAGSTANSLRFKTPGAFAVTLSGTANTLSSGAILVSSAVGANTSTITGGSFQPAANQEIIVNQRNTAGNLVINSAIGNNGGASALTKLGPGRLVLSGPFGAGGITNVIEGTLELGSSNAYTASAPNGGWNVAATGNGVELAGFNATLATLTGGGTVTNSNAATSSQLTIANTANATFSGAITGTVDLIKTGTGQLTLRGANTFTGVGGTAGRVIVAGGLLLTDTQNGGPAQNILPASSSLVLRGGTFQSNSRTNVDTLQAFATTVVDAGHSVVNQGVRQSQGRQFIHLGAITRTPGATVNIDPDTSNNSGIFTTNPNNAILGGYATTGNNTWAFVSTTASGLNSSQFLIRTGVTYNAGNTTPTLGAGTHTDLVASLAAAGPDNTAATVRFNNAAANTLDLVGGTNTIETGGILVTSAVGANVSTITGGNITSGNGADLILIQNNTSAGLTIASAVVNPAGGSIGLTKSGAGTALLTGQAAYTGTTWVNAGLLSFGGAVPQTIGNVVGNGRVGVAAGSSLTTTGTVKAGGLQVDGTHTLAAGAGTSRVNAVAIAGGTGAWTGKLDLKDNTLIINSADAATQAAALATLRDQILSGRAGGTWTGNGITSSTITAGRSLALVDAGDFGLTSFGGETGLDANSTILTIARNGDATLDGKVDSFDLNVLANNWQLSNKIWSKGDFNSDGIVDSFDLNILASNWQAGVSGSLEAALAAFPILSGTTPVPEPASLAVLALGGAALLGRRRRK
jgi:autotransporter-associated beta strand protein